MIYLSLYLNLLSRSVYLPVDGHDFELKLISAAVKEIDLTLRDSLKLHITGRSEHSEPK